MTVRLVLVSSEPSNFQQPLTCLAYLIQDNISKFSQCSMFVRKMNRITYALIIGGDDTSFERTFKLLKHCVHLLECPLLLPVVEMEVKADYARKVLDKCHRHLNDFEPMIGFHIDDEKNTKWNLMDPEIFDKQIRRLTATTGRLAWCEWTAEVHDDLLDFLKTELANLAVETPRSKAYYDILLRKIRYLKSFIQQNKSRAVYLEARRNGYIQTVSQRKYLPGKAA